MAQWIGYNSGLTHQSKVKDLEVSLRKAIAAIHSVNETERVAKWKAAEHLAERLHASRVKLLRVRISELREEIMGRKNPNDKSIARLENEIVRLQENGIEAILKEFGADQARRV
jgi:hypothetical protein